MALCEISIRQGDALLRHFGYTQKPEALKDEEWAEQLQDLHWIRNEEKKANEQK